MRHAEEATSWQQEFPVAEFCQLLGIPEGDAPYLFMVSASLFGGVSVQFMRSADAAPVLHWSRSWWSARRFCKRLGLPGAWGRHLLTSWPDARRSVVELKFICLTPVKPPS